MYQRLLRPFLFLFDAERVHHASFFILKIAFRVPLLSGVLRRYFQVNDPRLARTVFGLHFPNPVGLAAGFDKNAELVDELAGLGFGFIEIGTLTPKPQPGNDKPRLFRLKADSGIINRMGFNNQGVAAAAERLRQRKSNVIVGGNIGKNKATPNENAADDYLICFEALFDVVDYFVVNVSSPNTPNLRELQEKAPLTALLKTIQTANKAKPSPKPILLKIAPDLSDSQLDDIVEIFKETHLDGIIATNTTIARTGLHTPENTLAGIGAGGLSGKPLKERATEVIRYLHQRSVGPIVGVGGIHTPEDALEKLRAGAALIQVYTGFVYEGPGQVREINKYIAENQ